MFMKLKRLKSIRSTKSFRYSALYSESKQKMCSRHQRATVKTNYVLCLDYELSKHLETSSYLLTCPKFQSF